MTSPRQTVLVTAGAGGAGLVIARRFAAGGAQVVICDVDSQAVDAATSDGRISGLVADVAEEAGVEQVFAFAEARFGPVSILINNAGISGPTAPVESVSVADWERTLAVNLTGQFMCIRRAVPAMKAAGDGLIINISSGSAKVGLPLRSPYVVSKAAVLSLTTTLARELGPHGVRINAILPGAIRGARIQRIIAEKAAAGGVTAEAYEQTLLRYVSLRTMVEPDDIADMILFLASPGAARITGQCIGVDGNIEYEE